MDDPATPSRRPLLLDAPESDAGAAHVLIVAADPLARAGLAALLAEHPAFDVAGSAAPDDDLADALDLFQPDVVLWDLGLADPLPADFSLFQEDDLPVVALLPDEGLVAEAWAAGARALLPRDAASPALAAALAATLEGLVVLDPSFAEAVLAVRETVPAAVELTPREREVLALVAEGLPNKLIADRLSISENTVKFHLSSILGKLGAHSRTEAVVQATRLGLLII